MKKTISLAALAISTSASAFWVPQDPSTVVHKTYCLEVYTIGDTGDQYAGSCDQSHNNAERHLQINRNGCADGQIALTTTKLKGDKKFPIEIRSCLPPNVAQL